MPGALNRAVAGIIRAHMQESSMSQAELARKIGVAGATMSRVFNGKTPMTVDQFEALCKALRLEPSEVISEATG